MKLMVFVVDLKLSFSGNGGTSRKHISPRKDEVFFFLKWGLKPRLLHHDDAHGLLLISYEYKV
jgi:hypothetical protein